MKYNIMALAAVSFGLLLLYCIRFKPTCKPTLFCIYVKIKGYREIKKALKSLFLCVFFIYMI